MVNTGRIHVSNNYWCCCFIVKGESVLMCSIAFFSTQPSHSDKAGNPEVLRWVNELAKLRKELKGKTEK